MITQNFADLETFVKFGLVAQRFAAVQAKKLYPGGIIPSSQDESGNRPVSMDVSLPRWLDGATNLKTGKRRRVNS